MPRLSSKNVLDCGCGRGSWGYLLRSEKMGEHAYLIGFDLWRPYIEFCKKYQVYDDLILADAKHMPFRNRAFNIVLASELIEHLTKADGDGFLNEITRICTGVAIITTPLLGVNQPPPPNELTVIPDTPLQTHKSTWTVKDFRVRGYQVHGIGLKWITIWRSNPYLWGFFRYVFTPLTYILPQLAELLVAAKAFHEGLAEG